MTFDIDTPALLLDQGKLDKNIKDIIEFANEYNVNYRPHIKTHKSINIAKLQMAYGAVGITVATVGEAEVMSQGGIQDILIAYPIATKLERIEKLMKASKMTIAVDSITQANILNDYFKQTQYKLNVWIKINSGLNRCGVEPSDIAELAGHINRLSHLQLDGIFTHAGHSYAAQTDEELEEIAQAEAASVLESAELCENIGIEIKHRSIGSTPTFKIAGRIEGITEIRPGNAVFYDMVQVGLNVATKEQCALTVLSTVGSKHKDRLVIDAGSKTLNLDRGAHGNENITGHGFIKEYPELNITRLSEEHGVIPIESDVDLEITDKLTIIPNHACTVVNLFDYYTVHQEGKIIDRWPVDARGKVD